jgi:hypothetical protein
VGLSNLRINPLSRVLVVVVICLLLLVFALSLSLPTSLLRFGHNLRLEGSRRQGSGLTSSPYH